MKLTRSSGLTLNADKTEILNLSNSIKNRTYARYNEVGLSINHKQAITITGNYLTLDDNDCYQENVIKKIDKLNSQLNRWKGRNLSINGKMIIVKTFAISQLIFTSQFQIIRPKEVRKIESLCYAFVWNGTDRVKRNVIKSGRDNGGINGIDVESFLYAIAVRQFEKSKIHRKLNFVNLSPDIKEDVKTHARTIIRKLLMSQLANCDITCQEDAKWLAQTRADLFVKSYSNMHRLLCQMGIDAVASIMQENYSRKHNGIIRRTLPTKAILTIDRYVTDRNIPSSITLIIDNKEHEILKLGSRRLNDLIKQVLKKVVPYHPAERYNFSNTYFGDIRQTWTNLWLIKNPTLRSIRLKILHKDIWTQEKRSKLGICNSSACEICGETETVAHQLVTCNNAKRMWNLVGQSINRQFLQGSYSPEENLAKLMVVSSDFAYETVKSVIFKLLIQIDRSRNLSIKQINKHIIYWLRIEQIAINKINKNNKYLTKVINKIIIKLST